MIKLNLKGGFKIVQEGERTLEITDVKVTPSGAPEKIVLTMKDVEDGASLQNTFSLKNERSVWAMGLLLSIALDLKDGDSFDTNDVNKLIGIKLLCEVAHTEYNDRKYANVKKVIKRIDNKIADDEVDFKAIDALYGRNEISNDDDDLD